SAGVTLTGSGATAVPAGVGGGASNQQFWGQLFQVYDDAFYSHGNHGFKFGFAFMANQLNIYSPLVGVNGNGTFSNKGIEPKIGGSNTVATFAEGNTVGPGTAGTICYTNNGKDATNGNNYDPSCGSLVNFLTNQPNAATTTFDSKAIYKHYWRNKIFAGYVQDDWRIRPSLTLNLGLRYEMTTIPKS